MAWVDLLSMLVLIPVHFHLFSFYMRVSIFRSKKGGIDQESIQSNTTPGPGYHMEECQKHN